MASVMVRSHSRLLLLRVHLNEKVYVRDRGSIDAFTHFGGPSRVNLYEHLMSAVLECAGDAIRFNPRALGLAKRHHFEPRPVAKARGTAESRVKRAIRQIRRAFFAARIYRGIDDLNKQAHELSEGEVTAPKWVEDDLITVQVAYRPERHPCLRSRTSPFLTKSIAS
jgi:hypothetical protein